MISLFVVCHILLLFIGFHCPDGFLEHKRRCYGFFVYSYARSTWKEAQKKCRSFNGGDLIRVSTKKENDFIAKKLLELNPDLKEKEHYYPWIGLYLKKGRNRSKLLKFDC